MRHLITQFSAFLFAALIACSLAVVGDAHAIDKVHLKDGRVLEGTVEQEIDGNVWMLVKISGIDQRQFFRAADVESIERDAAHPADAKPTSGAQAQAKARTSTTDRSKRAAVITLGEGGDKNMVGLYMTAENLKRLIPVLEEENIGIVVFHINSGGGLALEVQRLSDVIQDEYKPRFRTVSWIESAISAAAMTSHCIEDIYFMPQGNYGACTAFSGALVAAKDRDLEGYLYTMEKISARGQKDPQIMRSMQIMEPLSCSIDSNGDVRWFNSLDGEYIVNPEGRILTFNAVDAEKYKFSKGTAANVDELADRMGLTEVEWVGESRPGYLWPICKAEAQNMKYREQVYQDETALNQYMDTYNNAVNAARADQDRTRRGAMVGRARDALRRIVRVVKNNSNIGLLRFGAVDDKAFQRWVDEQEEMLRDLMR